jgi:hypothetical protein
MATGICMVPTDESAGKANEPELNMTEFYDSGLDVLECGAHLFSNWPQESFRCRHNLAVELRHLQARSSPYY